MASHRPHDRYVVSDMADLTQYHHDLHTIYLYILRSTKNLMRDIGINLA